MEECGAAGDESTGVGEKEVREIQIAFLITKFKLVIGPGVQMFVTYQTNAK